jgi:ABC-type transport system substrate-binding protein
MQYCNPDVDKLIQDTASVVDDAKRSALYKQIYKILVEAAILLPLISNGPLIVGKSNVKDIAYTINAYPLFHNVTLA